MTYKKESFDSFLRALHMKYEGVLHNEDIEEAYKTWLVEQGNDLLIAYGEKWCSTQSLANVEANLE